MARIRSGHYVNNEVFARRFKALAKAWRPSRRIRELLSIAALRSPAPGL